MKITNFYIMMDFIF